MVPPDVNSRDVLVAYLATLIALVAVVLGALAISAFVPGVLGKIEVFGLGTVTGGLIGVLRMPALRNSGSSEATTNALIGKVPPTEETDKGTAP